jgi:glycosyltransferase involved in cell wall biosynthesis
MISVRHILILTPGFPANEDDFNCIPPLQEFLLKFKTQYQSIKISVIAFQYPFAPEKYLWNRTQIFSLKGKNSKIKKPFTWLKGIRIANALNKKLPIDVIHSLWLGECAFVGTILSNKFNCPHICTLMGQDVKTSNRYLRFSKNRNIKIVALSQNQFDQFAKISARRPDEIIHWGIDDQNFSNTKKDIDLLAVGSLISLKNYKLLIRLIAELKIIKPDINCKLVGDGPQMNELMRLAENERISKNLEFTGLLSRKEIFKLMQRSKIFVHPSKFEGSGYVFAEALANGMNIVSFNVGYAQNHPKWFIAKDEDDFKKIAEKLLNKELDFKPVNIFPLKETVRKYASLYGIY